MSINSMNSRFAMAEKMSIPQLQQSIQAGSLPAYVGVPLIEQRMQEQKKAAAMAQLAQAQQQAQQFGVPTEKPIAQGIMEQAAGIEAVPSNLPVAGYNDGGIVAFADGGEADDDFDYEEYQDEQDQAEYQDLLNAYMAEAEAAGLEGIPVNQTKKVEVGVEKKADGGIIGLNAGGIPRFQSQGYVEDPLLDVPAAEDIYSYDQTAVAQGPTPRRGSIRPRNRGSAVPETANTDYADALRRNAERAAGVAESDRMAPGSELPEGYVTSETVGVAPLVRPSVDSGMFSGVDLAGPDVMPPKASSGAPASSDGIANIPAGGAGTVGTGTRGAPVTTGATSPTARPKTAFEEFINNIKEERAALAKQKQDDKYMALLSAGLGMMSGTSPNAFANIGQGAQAGVAQYAASAKQRAAEKAALNKSLLMGHRYQSMEDIAARTADINEARYREAAAARALAAGSSTKAEDQMRRKLSDIGALYERRSKLLSDQASKINQYVDPEGYRAAQAALKNDPQLNNYANILNKLTEEMYGISSAPQEAPSASSNVLQYDSKGNRIK